MWACRKFNVTELVVVLALLAILAGLGVLFLGHRSSHPQRAYRISCANNLKQIGLAAHMYAEDYGGAGHPEALDDVGVATLPTSLRTLLESSPDYSAENFQCPVTDDKGEDYWYCGTEGGASGGRGGKLSPATGIAADIGTGSAKPNHEEFGNVLFGDMHVEGKIGPQWGDGSTHSDYGFRVGSGGDPAHAQEIVEF